MITAPPDGERLHVRVGRLTHLYDGMRCLLSDAVRRTHAPIACQQEERQRSWDMQRLDAPHLLTKLSRVEQADSRERGELLTQVSVSASSHTRGQGCCTVGERSARHPPRATVQARDVYMTGIELLIEP